MNTTIIALVALVVVFGIVMFLDYVLFHSNDKEIERLLKEWKDEEVQRQLRMMDKR